MMLGVTAIARLEAVALDAREAQLPVTTGAPTAAVH